MSLQGKSVRGKKVEQKPWKVAIERPLPGEQTLYKIITVNQDEPLAVMTSGTYRHYFDANGQRYSHVLDARIGAPVRHQTVPTTVFIDDATYADAWSTAFLCLGSSDGYPRRGFNSVLNSGQNRFEITRVNNYPSCSDVDSSFGLLATFKKYEPTPASGITLRNHEQMADIFTYCPSATAGYGGARWPHC